MSDDKAIAFLQWALPNMGYRWEGFRKPRNQVLRRIRGRMQTLGLTGGYSEYKEYLQTNPQEWNQLDKLCDVTISKFFRDRKVWDFMRDNLLPALFKNSDSQTISTWSAGCCNGEEAYSLAIISEQIAETFDSNISVNILASDRNTEVMERARAGRYPSGSLKELTQREIDAFFDKQEQAGEEEYQIKQSITRQVTFDQRDICNALPRQIFDIILCRNLVFTYFTKKRQQTFLDRLKPHLSDHGHLVIGANEEVPDLAWLSPVSKTHKVFAKN
ncbi:MAG: CheR family methyltransferase [Balneolaceae bacterium]|nr:CheR family methyltransferase [Balneolaceae bacterium]